MRLDGRIGAGARRASSAVADRPASVNASRSSAVISRSRSTLRRWPGERDVLGREHEHDDPDEDRTSRHLTRGGSSNRNPTPRTASIQRASPSFLRTAATWASTVLVGPYQLVSQTCSRISVRRCTAPGSVARNASRSNSLAVRFTGSSPIVTRRVRRSIVSGPIVCGSSAVAAVVAGGPPGDGPDAGDQLADAERLRHVVVGAELEPEHPVELVAARREHDDRHVRRRATAARGTRRGRPCRAARGPAARRRRPGRPRRPAPPRRWRTWSTS